MQKAPALDEAARESKSAAAHLRVLIAVQVATVL